MSGPYAPFMEDIGGTMPILPEHIWKDVDNPMDYVEPGAFIGSGPFKYVDFSKEHGTYQYEAFDEYHLGRPNVGKSSLLNSLIGEERNIVTPEAGTTRDSIFIRYQKYNHDFYLVDTAGIRKKGKVTEDIEFYSVLRAIRAIENSDVCLVIIDATRGLESQDLNIVNLAKKNHKGLVILVNKWDLIEKDTNTTLKFEKTIKQKLEPFSDIPVLFISAINKQRIYKVLEKALAVFEKRKQKISTSRLNNVLLKAIDKYSPPAARGRYIKIKYITQLPTHAPSFAFFSNFPDLIKEPYRRYLENRIRESFDFSGVPIQIFFRKK